MVEKVSFQTQYVGKADVRQLKDSDTKQNAQEKRVGPEQQRFFDRYQRELSVAHTAEREANRAARDRLKALSAPELRKIGAKQLAWGWGLSFINAVGGGLGALVGGLSAYGIGSAVGLGAAATVVGVWGAAGVGLIGGAVAGAELVHYVYHRFIRKYDSSLPKLDKTDRILGDILAPLTMSWTSPMVAGVRNIFDGYNNMKSIQ